MNELSISGSQTTVDLHNITCYSSVLLLYIPRRNQPLKSSLLCWNVLIAVISDWPNPAVLIQYKFSFKGIGEHLNNTESVLVIVVNIMNNGEMETRALLNVFQFIFYVFPCHFNQSYLCFHKNLDT